MSAEEKNGRDRETVRTLIELRMQTFLFGAIHFSEMEIQRSGVAFCEIAIHVREATAGRAGVAETVGGV